MKRISVALTVSIVLALGVAACDDDDSGSGAPANEQVATGPDGGATGERSKAGEKRDRYRAGKRDGGSGSGGGSSAKPQPAELGDRYAPDRRETERLGDGSIQQFGEALPDDEAQEAVAVAVGYYDARAAKDWGRACALMATPLKQRLEQLAAAAPDADGEGCPALLADLTAGVPRKALAKEARGIRFTEVRVEDDRAFALFEGDPIGHGTMPMLRENGSWKVAALGATSL